MSNSFVLAEDWKSFVEIIERNTFAKMALGTAIKTGVEGNGGRTSETPRNAKMTK